MMIRPMFSGSASVFLVFAATLPLIAGVPPEFEDSPLRAVQFVDARVGWAVGDDGSVWQSIDAGQTWERFKVGQKASFRSICFLTPYTGWIAGRVDESTGLHSRGVLFSTSDGGVTWRDVSGVSLPGLNYVKFFDEHRGIVAGDSTTTVPSGILQTTDGGKTWKAIAGPKASTWLAADLTRLDQGVVAGGGSRLMLLRQGKLIWAASAPMAGRSIRGVAVSANRTVAVADGGQILLSDNPERSWDVASLPLPASVLACMDFRAVSVVGEQIWVAGRPGSFVLHSPDFGKSWQMFPTGHPIPLNSLQMLNAHTGWAVGELGTILGTTDGGRSWKLLKCGGQRAALLTATAQPSTTPLGVIARLGSQQRYLTVALAVNSPPRDTSVPCREIQEQRFAAAIRACGGAAAELAWGFPLPEQVADMTPDLLQTFWNADGFADAQTRLIASLVLAIRTWRPEVMISESFPFSDHPARRLVLLAAQEAFKQAADPRAFPEQLTILGLEAHAVKKLYAQTPTSPDIRVKYDLSEFVPEFGDSVRDAVAAAVSLSGGAVNPPDQAFRLISHRLPAQTSSSDVDLMDGISLAEGGTARRAKRATVSGLEELLAERAQAARRRQSLEALLSLMGNGTDSERILSQAVAQFETMPDDMAARAAVDLGQQLFTRGRWTAARELLALAADRYPAHPETGQALRWLARYYSSSEVRRRLELGQQAIYQKTAFIPAVSVQESSSNRLEPAITAQAIFQFNGAEASRAWSQACLELQAKLAAFGPDYLRDPATNLCLLAARRQLGLHGDATKVTEALLRTWRESVEVEPGQDAWHDCLAAELWIGNHSSPSRRPKPLGFAAVTATRPFLDARLTEPAWQRFDPLMLTGPGENDYATTARFAYDDRFLYVGVRCGHPPGKQVPRVEKRGYDADLRGHDRVEILLDLDRDYQTAYRFQIDHRGCVAEDCWGDRTWNPRWFVALEPDPSGWTAEIAIPWSELTSTPPRHGHIWAANVVRIIPEVGIQAWSHPAGTAPRLEGLGLLQFDGKEAR